MLTGANNAYIKEFEIDKRVIILSDDPLSVDLRRDLDNIFKKYDLIYQRSLEKDQTYAILEKMLNEHKGTVAEGKCFLAADDFVLGVDKEGKIKPVVDCTTNK
jgi:hypothetical protein